MKKLVSLVLILSLMLSMTCFAERQRVGEIEPRDRDIAFGSFGSATVKTGQKSNTNAMDLFSLMLGKDEYEKIKEKIIGWSNEEIYFEDDFGRIVGRSNPLPAPAQWQEREITCFNPKCRKIDIYVVNFLYQFPVYCRYCGCQIWGLRE